MRCRGQIIVKYKPSVNSTEEASIRRQEDLNKKEELGLIDAEVVKVKGRSTETAIRDLEHRPDVEYAQPDYIYQSAGYDDEPLFGSLWGLDNTGQTVQGQAGTSNVDTDALEASAITQGDGDLTVAVLEGNGFDPSHPDLSERAWTNSDEIPANGIDDDGNGYVDDVNGWNWWNDNNRVYIPSSIGDHGTHVAGTIAASVNGRGIVGVAPNVEIMALKVGDGMRGISDSAAIQGIEYAKVEGAKIMNASWGHVGTINSDPALKEAIEASGALFVASAGNGGSDGVGDNNDAVPSYPASFDSPNVLSVANINNRGALAPSSNFGAASVDISAPGTDILSTVPAITPESISGVTLSNVGASGKAVVSGFGAEEISDGATARASFFTKAFSAVNRGSQQVVVVDDDLSDIGNPDVGPTISSAIQSATGTAPTVMEVPYGSDGPSLSQMQGKTVVWATGEAFYSELNSSGTAITKRTLTNPDFDNLTGFLEGGGKLVLTGQDHLYLRENTNGVLKTLGLAVLSDQGATGFTGETGTAFGGESYDISAVPQNHDVLIPASHNTAAQGIYDDYSALIRPPAWSFKTGTSMAAPHVAGVAALVASVEPELLSDPVALKNRILDTGKPAPATVGKTVTGDIVDADAAIDEQPAVDTQNPTVALTAPNANAVVGGPSVSLSANASDNVGVSRVEFLVNGNEVGEDASSPYGVAWNSTDVSDGRKTVTARAFDAQGNSAISAGRQVVVDNFYPNTLINSGPPGSTRATTATFRFSSPGSPDVIGFQCKLDRGGFAPCRSPKVYRNLSKTRHTFSVRSIGSAGAAIDADRTPATKTWTVLKPRRR